MTTRSRISSRGRDSTGTFSRNMTSLPPERPGVSSGASWGPLLRIAVVWNVMPIACNRATADYVISSPLLAAAYEREVPRYETDVWRDMRTA